MTSLLNLGVGLSTGTLLGCVQGRRGGSRVDLEEKIKLLIKTGDQMGTR